MFKLKSISPIISVVLLIVVAIVIVTMILVWGKSFTHGSGSKADNFVEADPSSSMLDFESLSNGKLIFKNISPIGSDPIKIVGYDVISSVDNRILNTVNLLDDNITLNPGESTSVNIVTPPENNFKVHFYTDEGKYIELDNVKNSTPLITFSKTFGPSNGFNNLGTHVEQTRDGGYIVSASTYNLDNLFLMKFDSLGNQDWNVSFDDGFTAYSVTQTDSGDYIVAGTSSSKAMLLKVDNNGTIDWNKTFNIYDSSIARDVKETPDGGYIITGNYRDYSISYSDYYLFIIKTDSNGNEDWNKFFYDVDYGSVMSLDLATDGGYIVGSTKSNRYFNLIKLDSQGNKDWNMSYQGSMIDTLMDIEQTNDNGYILFGYGYNPSPSEDEDLVLLKTDSNGNEDWNRVFSGIPNHIDRGYAVDQTSDGGYILAGYKDVSTDSSTNYDIWLIKTDSNGNEDWNKTFGTTNSTSGDYAWSVKQTTDGGYIVTGKMDNKYICLLKTDSSGNIN